jgi:hypothetical protein
MSKDFDCSKHTLEEFRVALVQNFAYVMWQALKDEMQKQTGNAAQAYFAQRMEEENIEPELMPDLMSQLLIDSAGLALTMAKEAADFAKEESLRDYKKLKEEQDEAED